MPAFFVCGDQGWIRYLSPDYSSVGEHLFGSGTAPIHLVVVLLVVGATLFKKGLKFHRFKSDKMKFGQIFLQVNTILTDGI